MHITLSIKRYGPVGNVIYVDAGVRAGVDEVVRGGAGVDEGVPAGVDVPVVAAVLVGAGVAVGGPVAIGVSVDGRALAPPQELIWSTNFLVLMVLRLIVNSQSMAPTPVINSITFRQLALWHIRPTI